MIRIFDVRNMMGRDNYMKINLKNMFIAPLALMSLSACVYGDGYSQNGLGYNDDQYCDPYNEYDAYYGCDLEYGFANFGYGGGWHQDFYYPGFGFFIFDNLGRRHRMNDYYLGYWGRKRQRYFQSRFSNRSFSGYRLRSFPWSERRGKRLVRGNGVRGDRARSDRDRAPRRADRRNDRNENRRDDRFENRQDRRQARRDRRDQNENIDNRQRSERRDRRNERRAARRSDSDGSGARQRGRNGNAAQAGNRDSQQAQPPARQSQNRQERSRPPRQNNVPPRARETSQNNRPPRARPRVRQNPTSRPGRTSKGTWQRNNTKPK